ncbi:Hypothetical predicted protein [Octopus vulgaris]|uniref:Phosphate carrier protein, mitochondrial n=2 Tax=Octopus vulgaris TaxID=6645 RepID=A0AA36ATW2_OCTVU|nr:Hypothetical predicted protein [Octopus vulgaris]
MFVPKLHPYNYNLHPRKPPSCIAVTGRLSKMFESLIKAAKVNPPFSNPFYAKCESLLPVNETRTIAAANAAETTSCEYGSAKYYALCGFGGILSCGITHTAVVPLDLVKCRIQVDPAKYGNIFSGFKVTIKEDGKAGLTRGWAPTFIGYSLQGLGKFGFYEVFKITYSNLLGEENTFLWRTSLYLAASASAEFFADILLCPMEAAKVKIQTSAGYANTLRECIPKMIKEEGMSSDAITGYR